MRNILLIIITLISCTLPAEVYRGFVQDNQGNPLYGAMIIHGSNSVMTEEDGYFILKSEAQADSLIIHYAFHEIVKVNRHDFTKTLTFKLKPKDMELATYTFTAKKKSQGLPSAQEKVVISVAENSANNASLAEVLTSEKGIKIEGTKLAGERQTASILGHSSRHTLVMLDGIPLNNNGEDFDLSAIPVEVIDEVEIYKNNVSSLSGGGGIAGVINIKTKRNKNNHELSLKGTYGSYNYRKFSLNTGFNLQNTSVYAVFSQQDTDNDFKYRIKKGNEWHTAKRENNEKHSRNAMINVSSKLKQADIYFSSNLNHFDNQLPGPTNFLSLYNGANITGYDLYSDLKVKMKLGKIDNSLEFHYLDKESEYQNLTPTIPITKADNRSDNTRLGTKLINSTDLDKLQLTLTNSGLREIYSYRDRLNNEISIDETSQNSFASNLVGQYEDTYDLWNYNLVTSFRYDAHDRFNDFQTYRISGDVSYDYLIKPSLLFSYGTGYNIPSFYSLYWKGDSHAVGNSDLVPEKSQGYQLGLNLEYSRLEVKLNYSHNEIDNLIQWIEVQLQGGIWKPVNIGRSQIKNLELESAWEVIPNLHLTSKAVFTDTENLTLKPDGTPSSYYGKKLVYIPEYLFNLSADYQFRRYKIGFEFSKTGSQWTSQDNLHNPLPANELLNSYIHKSFDLLKCQHTISLNLNNLLNKYYEVVSYNPQAPFNWSLAYSINYKFK